MNRIVLLALAIAMVVIVVAGYVNYEMQFSAPSIGKPVPPDIISSLKGFSAEPDNFTIPTSEIKPLPYDLTNSTDHKPLVVYIGAEWCPYCAAERWALVIALMRFGNFSNLSLMESSPTDVYPDTPTFTFYGSHYSSPYIDFLPIEYQDRYHNNLVPVPQSLYNIWMDYANGSIPFIAVSGKYQVGATVDPSYIQGKNWTYVVELIGQGGLFAREVLGTANVITAEICSVDGNQPMNICGEPLIQHLEQELPGGTLYQSAGNPQNTLVSPLISDAWRPSL